MGGHLTTPSHIAHETKVLSINAAIEACKAGAQGTGFYQIAEAIRKLSETASQLTQELSKFMDLSNTQAEEGSGLAQSAHDNVERMVSTVDGISRQITDMGAAYEDHQQHVTEVFEQVKVLTSTIESNAGSVTQSADAAKRLSAQATSLQELIGALNDTVNQFQIARDDPGTMMTETPFATQPEAQPYLVGQMAGNAVALPLHVLETTIPAAAMVPTLIPESPILGLITHQGRTIAVLSPSLFVHDQTTAQTRSDAARIVVLRSGFGLLFDDLHFVSPDGLGGCDVIPLDPAQYTGTATVPQGALPSQIFMFRIQGNQLGIA